MRGFLKILAASMAVAVCAVEITFTIYDGRQDARRHAAPEPFYTWSLYASDGQTRLSRDSGPLRLVLDPVTGYRNLPNQSGPWFRINSRGHRGPELSREAGLQRIVLVGSSTAFGTGAWSDEDTFARRLERQLGSVQVVNAAVIGYVSAHELTLLETELLALEPALVIAFDGYNDARAEVLAGSGPPRLVASGFRQLEQGLVDMHRIRTNPLRALHAVPVSLFPHIGRRIPRLERWPLWFERKLAGGTEPEPDVELRVRLYAANIERMAGLTRRNNAAFLALVQPQRQRKDEHYDRFAASAARRWPPRASSFSTCTSGPRCGTSISPISPT